jgi:hypothetical protein
MKAHDVAALVAARAARIGDRDPQQRRQLAERLSKLEAAEVGDGLLEVFMRGEGPPSGSSAQELAGHLLLTLEPPTSLQLEDILRALLPRYELSVEQLPSYLTAVFGEAEVIGVLNRLESELSPEAERRAVATLQFWLGSAKVNGSET